MSQHAASTEPDSTAKPADDTPFHQRILHELIEIGAAHARLTLIQAEAQAKAHAEAANAELRPIPEPAEAPALAFDRIARAIRRTILLAQKLAEPRANTHAPNEAAHRRILRDVEDTIQRTARPDQAEALHRELLDRLEAPELAEDLATLPIAEIVMNITRDLGLAAAPGTSPWKRRAPADAAYLHTLASRLAHPPRRAGQGPKPSQAHSTPANSS